MHCRWAIPPKPAATIYIYVYVYVYVYVVGDSPKARRNAGRDSERRLATTSCGRRTHTRTHAGLDGNLLVQLVQTTLLDLPSGEEDPSGELERMQSFARIAEEGGTY